VKSYWAFTRRCGISSARKHAPGKWRLIVDLSSPKKFSINDGIDPSGVPLAQEKSVRPTSCPTFVGIEVDTEQTQLCLPAEKLQ